MFSDSKNQNSPDSSEMATGTAVPAPNSSSTSGLLQCAPHLETPVTQAEIVGPFPACALEGAGGGAGLRRVVRGPGPQPERVGRSPARDLRSSFPLTWPRELPTSIHPLAGFSRLDDERPRAGRAHLPVQINSTEVSPDGMTNQAAILSRGGSPLGAGIPLTVLLARE